MFRANKKGWFISGITIATLISGIIFLFLTTIFLIIVGALGGSIDDQNIEHEDGGSGVICSPDGELNEENWEQYFDDPRHSGMLMGYGDDIIELSEEKGLDPVLFGAITLHETGYGKSVALRTKNNPGGLMESDGKTLQTFNSIRDGLEAMSVTLYNRIIVDGLVTIEDLGNVYAPIGVDNDPDNLNEHWVPTMKKLTKDMGGLTINCESMKDVDMDVIGGRSWVTPHTKTITSSFGYRQGCGTCTTLHKGIDIASEGIKGTPITSFADGKVTVSDSSGTTHDSNLANMGTGYGWYVEIDHGDGIKTRYGHMLSKGIAEGRVVKAGDVIGTVGSTGASTGPHIHFEILIDDEQIDPMSHVIPFLADQ